MDAVSALILAGALFMWPAATASKRLTALKSPPRRAFRLPRPSMALLVVVGALVGWVLLGPGGAILCAAAGGVGWRYWQARQRLRHRMTVVEELTETLRSLVGELRAGAHPVAAAESVAADAPPSGAEAMRAIAAAARMGGDVEQAVHEPLFTDIAHAWALAHRHGLPLADVLAAVVRDLDQRLRFAKQTHAQMAGPRTSAVVLACLPLAGIGLGQLLGTHSLRMLSETMAGQALLVVGIGLIIAGVFWSGRLTRQVVLP
ncbi:type II secretion system F family protein [Kibdelosporangium philippinense]|uniref:Type II secretion system F family protein n=2 Tax=Kibdelosporangium philippinense TaxID=211113 RepID=A0ABS8ZNF9_9PSEU|nr:type II secretion system F family protein [Kibdelosporangium philippinense]MCE7009300.1 type II secretion system F family protein [Kibdelosporangium philippinense]